MTKVEAVVIRERVETVIDAVEHATGHIGVTVIEAIGHGRQRGVTHEYVHAVLHSLAPRGVPTWLNEGLATYFEPGDHAWLTQRLRTANPIPLRMLEESFDRLDGEDALVAYAESCVAARVLVERLGPSFPTFLQYVGNGTSVDQALLLFNISPDDIQREWSRRAGTK